MIYSYLKIAWRSFLKEKRHSFINVTGMTLGMTCFILIALYIQYELSYDQQNAKSERIYRVAQEQIGNTFRGTDQFAVSPVPLVPSLIADFPEVETGTTIAVDQCLFWLDGQALYENGLYADPNLLEVFDYPVISGDVQDALKDPSAIILTEALAKKYFGSEAVEGQSMQLADDRFLTVKAVIKDLPPNQHFRFDFITSLWNYGDYKGDFENQRWASNNYWSYIVLQKGYDYHNLDGKLESYGEKARAELAKYNLPFNPRFYLQPLADIHLHSNINAEIGGNGDVRYIYLSATIAFIVLFLALINYINLATARSYHRSKEVGVRKVLGAVKKQLIKQFMIESLLTTLVSFLLAICLANLFLPAFNRLIGFQISFSLGDNRWIFMSLISVAVFLGICSGLYPAILSAASTPVKALKGNWFEKRRGDRPVLRNALVISQFTAAIVLAISSVVVFQQLGFIQHKKLGYNREQIISVPYVNQNILNKEKTLRSELLKDPNIKNVSVMNSLPHNTSNQGMANQWEGKADNYDLPIYRFRTDYHFIDLFQMELIEGRNLSPDFPTDTSETYILNEAAVKAIGWNTATGKSFLQGKVIGVVKDFHFQPFDLFIEPMYITYHTPQTSNSGNIAIKINSVNQEEALAYAEKAFKKVLPEVPFNFIFLDDAYNQLYQAETRIGAIFNVFTVIALSIACMGLFGLVTQNVIRRRKEIGIRKVLGATLTNIIGMVSRDFLKLVLAAGMLAVPLAWLSMNRWLEGFAYRIDLSWWVFIAAILVALVMAFFTVGSQSLKAALSNPVDAIRSE